MLLLFYSLFYAPWLRVNQAEYNRAKRNMNHVLGLWRILNLIPEICDELTTFATSATRVAMEQVYVFVLYFN